MLKINIKSPQTNSCKINLNEDYVNIISEHPSSTQIEYDKPFSVMLDCSYSFSLDDYLFIEAKADDVRGRRLAIALVASDGKQSRVLNLQWYERLFELWNLFCIPVKDFFKNVEIDPNKINKIIIKGSGGGSFDLKNWGVSKTPTSRSYVENPLETEGWLAEEYGARGFQLIYQEKSCRIFGVHSFKWNRMMLHWLHSSDIVVLSCPRYLDFESAFLEYRFAKYLNLKIDNIFVLCNSLEEMQYAQMAGFTNTYFISNGVTFNSENFTIQPTKKIYNAVYTANPISGRWKLGDCKRHHLAWKIPNLALITGSGKLSEYPPNVIYKNKKILTPTEVCTILNQSHIGLCLSSVEGVMRANVEYLLSGLPVVTTKNKGGRDEFYEDWYRIVSDDTQESVADAVEELMGRKIDPQKIRASVIDKLEQHQARLYDLFESIKVKHNLYYQTKNIIYELANSTNCCSPCSKYSKVLLESMT